MEVSLDNTQRRMPVPNEQVVVRKSYNCDTDRTTYLLNGAHIQEKEIFNLFESAGFAL